MNRTVLIVVAAVCSLFYAPNAHAQFRWNAALEVGLSQNQNLFKSPDRFLSQGELLEAGSLYQNDMVIPLRVDAGIEYRTSSHRIELDYLGTADRYDQYGNLNGEYHLLRLRDTWALAKTVDMRLSLEGRKSKKIATNALGDQLSRLFEYTSAQSVWELNWDLSKRYAISVAYAFSYRDYTESINAPSLDSYTHRASLEWEYKSRKTRGAYWQAGIEAEYRLKTYLSYQSRDELGNQLASNPINELHHFSLEVDLRRALSKTFLIDVEVAGRYRYDFFEGYYSYGAASIEAGFEWEPMKRITLEGTVGVRRTHFFTKIAPQANSNATPLLRYTYLNGELSLQYDIVSWVSLETFASTTNRHSNATLETRLTRRSYETMEAGVSLTFDLDRALR